MKAKGTVMKFTENHLPEGHRVHVVHLHKGNSSKHKRHGHEYRTLASIYDKDGVLLGKGEAMCSHFDNPSRHIGRAVAVGRAMKDAYSTEEFNFDTLVTRDRETFYYTGE